MQPGFLFVGQTIRSELSGLVSMLSQYGRLQIAASTRSALDHLRARPDTELVLVAPSYRDEFSTAETLRLVQQQPLADIRILVGPWLEGETRSGVPVPGVRRLYLHQVQAWLRATCLSSSTTRNWPAEFVPATISAEESWQLAATARWPSVGGRVVVCSELASTRDYLTEVCAAAGLQTLGHGPDTCVTATDVAAVIYDAVQDRAHWVEHTNRLAKRYRCHRLIVLVNFPRQHEVTRLSAAGATDVLGKPFLVDQLLVCLSTLTRSNRTVA